MAIQQSDLIVYFTLTEGTGLPSGNVQSYMNDPSVVAAPTWVSGDATHDPHLRLDGGGADAPIFDLSQGQHDQMMGTTTCLVLEFRFNGSSSYDGLIYFTGTYLEGPYSFISLGVDNRHSTPRVMMESEYAGGGSGFSRRYAETPGIFDGSWHQIVYELDYTAVGLDFNFYPYDGTVYVDGVSYSTVEQFVGSFVRGSGANRFHWGIGAVSENGATPRSSLGNDGPVGFDLAYFAMVNRALTANERDNTDWRDPFADPAGNTVLIAHHHAAIQAEYGGYA